MRDDMFKVIVERPRWGSRSTFRPRNRLSGDGDLPVKIGLKRHAAVTRVRSKSLSENLNPLKRYLRKQIGRAWDDVYSEIAATLAPGHVVKEHVRQHIDDFVARKVSVDKNGALMNGDGWRPWRHLPWRQPFYVDPDDGVLKDSKTLWKRLGLDPAPWKRKPQPDPNVIALETLRELRRIEGIWYEVLFNRNRGTEPVFDLLERKDVPANTRHAVSKRQLSRAELEARGLKNSYND